MKTLKSLCQNVKMSVDYSSKECPFDKGDSFNAWKIQLRYKGRKMTIDFFTGPALGEPRDVSEIMDCVLSDSQAGEMDFSEFCSEFGYDEDSRMAEKTWKDCQKISGKVNHFLSDDYETFLYADRN